MFALTNFWLFVLKSSKTFYSEKDICISIKNELIRVLQLTGKKSLHIRYKLIEFVHNNLTFRQLKVVFQSPCKRKTLVHYKDTFDKKLRSNVV